MRIEPEIAGVDIVVVGNFNPAIFELYPKVVYGVVD